jgi:hypothetical protein
VPVPSARWRLIPEGSFDNTIGELDPDGRGGRVILRRSGRQGEDRDRLQQIHSTVLAGPAHFADRT